MKFKSLFRKRAEGLLDAKKHSDLELYKHFKVVKVLGSGSFATVYQVQRLYDGQMYALKHIDIQALQPEDRADLVNEIRLLSSLRHPGVMNYHEAFVENDQLFIITEFMAGGELAGLLRKRAQTDDWLPERQVWSFFLQITLGLRYLHHNHVLHRDLKPQNILLGDGGVVKIADLGISQKLDNVFACMPMGTPQYISPEMWRAQPYSYSADVWALGCILHEMCCLTPLFMASSDKEIRGKVLSGYVPAIPSRYSTELALLVQQMLTPDIMTRPTIEELLDMPGVQLRLTLLPPSVLPGGVLQVDELCTEISQPIKIPRQLWEWQCVNMCLPPSCYPSDGASAIEALWARPMEACRLYLEGSGVKQGNRLQHLSGRSCTFGRRGLSCPDLQEKALEERRNSVCVAEMVLCRRAASWPSSTAAGGKGGADAAAAGGLGYLGTLALEDHSSSDTLDLLHEDSKILDGSISSAEGRGLDIRLASGKGRGRGAVFPPSSLGGKGLGKGAVGSSASRRPWLKPFDPTPVEFCPRPGMHL